MTKHNRRQRIPVITDPMGVRIPDIHSQRQLIPVLRDEDSDAICSCHPMHRGHDLGGES